MLQLVQQALSAVAGAAHGAARSQFANQFLQTVGQEIAQAAVEHVVEEAVGAVKEGLALAASLPEGPEVPTTREEARRLVAAYRDALTREVARLEGMTGDRVRGRLCTLGVAIGADAFVVTLPERSTEAVAFALAYGTPEDVEFREPTREQAAAAPRSLRKEGLLGLYRACLADLGPTPRRRRGKAPAAA